MAYQRRNSDSKFERIVLKTVEETERTWLGVEQWKITDDRGTKISKPALAKRDKITDRNSGEVRTGKAKGLSASELDLIVSQYDELQDLLAEKKEDESPGQTPF